MQTQWNAAVAPRRNLDALPAICKHEKMQIKVRKFVKNSWKSLSNFQQSGREIGFFEKLDF